MAYRKSYYEQRTEEQARIREAIKKQQEAAAGANAAAEAPVVEAEPAPVADEAKPDESWTKSEIQEWLDKHEIKYSRWMTKSKLLELVD